jgi:phage gp46-like protein
MEYLLREGDYVPDGNGGLTALDGAQAVLQRVLFRLRARRGSFPFLPELGSQLYLLPRERPSARNALAERYAVQALEEETEVQVTGVELGQSEDGALTVKVLLDWQGETLSAAVDVW